MALKDFMKEFLSQDEEGSATVWSLFWTLIFLFLAGISIDASNAYRFKSALQMTADASSVGGILSYMSEGTYQNYTGDVSPRSGIFRGTEAATLLASTNMGTTRNGTVVPAGNVEFGRWDGGSFDPAGSPIDAVRVRAVRTSSNSNQLPTLLLGKFGIISSWDVGATSIAEAYYARCFGGTDEGLMAGATLQIASNNEFRGDLCLHGEERVDINNNNEFSQNDDGDVPGISSGAGGEVCSGFGNCQTEGFTNVVGHNVGLTETMISLGSLVMPDVGGIMDGVMSAVNNPLIAAQESDPNNHYLPPNMLTEDSLDREPGEQAYLETIPVLDTTTLPIGFPLPGEPGYDESSGVIRVTMTKTGFEAAVANHNSRPLPSNVVYVVDAGCETGNRRMDLDDPVVLSDMVIVTRCRVQFSNNIRFEESTLISTYTGTNAAVHGSSGVVIGGGNCADGSMGSQIIARNADIDFGAGLVVNNSNLITGADIDIAAQPNGMQGAMLLASNDVRVTSNGEWMGCTGDADNFAFRAYSYRLVY